MMSAFDEAATYVTTYGLNVLGGIVILVVGWTLAGWASRAVDVTLGRFNRFDLTLRRFVASVVRYLLLTFTLLAVLSQFGVQTASLIAVFGAAGLAIGLALQGTLANLAAGVMILVFRPFKIGDDVDVGGSRGTVESIDLFTTELRTPDNVQLLVPNGKIWGAPVTNYSIHQTRRVDLKLVVDGTLEIDRAIAAVGETLAQESRTLPSPKPSVTVIEVGETTTALAAQAWCRASDHDGLRMALMKGLKRTLQSALKTVSG